MLARSFSWRTSYRALPLSACLGRIGSALIPSGILRHDLRELAKDARFYDLLPVDRQAEYGTKFGLLNLRWRSNQRYMSEQQLRKYLSGIRADFEKKGDQFKNRNRTVLELAIDIVGLGDAKWDSKTA